MCHFLSVKVMIMEITIFRTFGGQCSLMLYIVIGLPLMMLFLAQVIIIIIITIVMAPLYF